MMTFLHQYWPHIAGTAGSGGLLAIVFRDSIRDVLADWKEGRRGARAERLAAAGKGDRTWERFFELLAKDIDAQRVNDARIIQVLEGVKEILTRLEGKTDAQGKQLDMVHQRTISIQGAVGRVQ